jgi:Tol biopolymer transport system component/photosystem II stability/assembly factor-like uncharacterized protein
MLHAFTGHFNAIACDKKAPAATVTAEQISVPIYWMEGWSFPRSVEGVSRYNSECRASLTADGMQMYFIAGANNGPPYSDEHIGTGFNIYVARWNGTAWDSITNLGPNVNPAGYGCISGDGQTLYMTRDDKIWKSTFAGSEWTEAEMLPWPVNEPGAEERAPFITVDGHQLYFSSNRDGGYGRSDLWVVRWNGSAWDSLTNLGPDLNTFAGETHPSLSPDGQTLYFSDFGGAKSGWKYGNSDLYVSTWTGSSWGPPSIVSAPVNSDHPLCSAFPSWDGRLYLGSGVSEGGFGEEDIWVVEAAPALAESRLEPVRVSTDWDLLGDLEGATIAHCLIEGWDGTIYAGTAPNGDVFRSTDGGESWETTAELEGAIQVYSLIEASDHSLLAGTYPEGDVFRSTNGGDSWVMMGDMPNATAVRALLEATNGLLFAGTSPDSSGWGRVYRSTDQGTSWQRVGLIPDVYGGLCSLAQAPDGAIFVGGVVWDDHIFVSPNNGDSWIEIDLPYDDAHITLSNFTVMEFTSDGTLWTGGWAHGPLGVLAYSTDNGISWDTTASIFNGDVEVSLIYDLLEEPDGSLLIGYQPGPDSVAMRSTNGGSTWERAGLLSGARELLCLLKTSDNQILAGTSADGGIYRMSPTTVTDRENKEGFPRAKESPF